MNRRAWFKTLFGAAVATVAAPLIPTVVKATHVAPDLSFLIAADLIAIQPMTAPSGRVFVMKIQPIDNIRTAA